MLTDEERRIRHFANRVAYELDANRHKGDWRRHPVSVGVEEVEAHLTKLKKALANGHDPSEFAADIGAASLMILNALGTLDENKAHPVPGTGSIYGDDYG